MRVGGFRDSQVCEEIQLQKAISNRSQQQTIQRLTVLKSDFSLGGVNIHVHQMRRHFQEQKADRVPAGHQQSAVGLSQSMLQTAVLNPAAIEKQELSFSSGLVERRVTDKPPQPNGLTVICPGF